jgi:recombination protein RecT
MTGQQVAKRSPLQELVAQVREPAFSAQVGLALPEGMPAERFLRIAVTALFENPDLGQAEPSSVRNSLLKAAGDGLLPDGREAALVLFKPKQGKPKAAYLPMIGGFRKIAADHGWTIETHSVFAEDDFAYELGERPTVTHRPAPLGVARTKIVAAYAVGRHLASGRTVLEVMTAEEVAKVRATAKSKAIWEAWEERMTEKTVGRRLFKTLPLGSHDDRVRRVLVAEELTGAELEASVYGTPASLTAGAAPSDSHAGPVHDESTPTASEQGGPSAADSPAAPFSGPPPAEQPAGEEADDDEAPFDYTFGDGWEETAYHGRTFADVVAARDEGWLEWLASDAVADTGLRAAAAAELEALRS